MTDDTQPNKASIALEQIIAKLEKFVDQPDHITSNVVDITELVNSLRATAGWAYQEQYDNGYDKCLQDTYSRNEDAITSTMLLGDEDYGKFEDLVMDIDQLSKWMEDNDVKGVALDTPHYTNNVLEFKPQQSEPDDPDK